MAKSEKGRAGHLAIRCQTSSIVLQCWYRWSYVRHVRQPCRGCEDSQPEQPNQQIYQAVSVLKHTQPAFSGERPCCQRMRATRLEDKWSQTLRAAALVSKGMYQVLQDRPARRPFSEGRRKAEGGDRSMYLHAYRRLT